MFDGNKIIPGFLVFLGVMTYPFAHNAMYAKMGYVVPKLELPKDQKECIEPKEAILADHKELLDQWKTSVVRNGVRTYEAHNKRRYLISLTRTCMHCHRDKTKFCDQCHEYLAVSDTPCWDCHSAASGPAEDFETTGSASQDTQINTG